MRKVRSCCGSDHRHAGHGRRGTRTADRHVSRVGGVFVAGAGRMAIQRTVAALPLARVFLGPVSLLLLCGDLLDRRQPDQGLAARLQARTQFPERRMLARRERSGVLRDQLPGRADADRSQKQKRRGSLRAVLPYPEVFVSSAPPTCCACPWPRCGAAARAARTPGASSPAGAEATALLPLTEEKCVRKPQAPTPA